jgi:anti-sigma regulatory factor (Ser/Thr protein kinase)
MTLAMEPTAAGPRDHVLHFYDDELELARTVGGYLRDTIASGAVAIVIATDPHRQAFVAELASAGIDPLEVCDNGTLVLLDASETMASFLHAGRVDAEAFHTVVGSVLRRAGGTGRPVRAYGEMVALLWEEGDVLAAIEVEKLWNDLGRELDFSLLCAYRSASVQGDEHAQALQQVCHLHSSELPSGAVHGHDTARPAMAEVSARFSATRDAPRTARHFMTDALEGWGYGGSFMEDAQLVVTELASNAVVHARSAFSVAARPEPFGLRISVHDASAVTPTVRQDDRMALSGRGLRLVEAIAADWGVDITPDGKVVWAELRA